MDREFKITKPINQDLLTDELRAALGAVLIGTNLRAVHYENGAPVKSKDATPRAALTPVLTVHLKPEATVTHITSLDEIIGKHDANKQSPVQQARADLERDLSAARDADAVIDDKAELADVVKALVAKVRLLELELRAKKEGLE